MDENQAYNDGGVEMNPVSTSFAHVRVGQEQLMWEEGPMGPRQATIPGNRYTLLHGTRQTQRRCSTLAGQTGQCRLFFSTRGVNKTPRMRHRPRLPTLVYQASAPTLTLPPEC